MKISYFKISKFLELRGWLSAEAQYDKNVSYFTNRNFPHRELYLPRNENAPDYDDTIYLLVNKLALLAGKPVNEVLASIESTDESSILEEYDTLLLRLLTARAEDSIPLRLAASAISEAEILLMISRCQVEIPKLSYKRVDNKLSNSLIDNTYFNHTQRGSFILNISSALLQKGEHLPLISNEVNDWPSARKAFVAMNRSIAVLQEVILEQRVGEFTKDLLHSKCPIVSSNFCETLGNLVVNANDPVEFKFKLSPLIKSPKDIVEHKSFSFDRNAANQLYEMSRDLMPEEQSRTGEFFGTVEALRGDLSSGEREGYIELLIYLEDEKENVRASAYLDAGNYKLADEAHIAGAQKLRIIGTLEPRPRVWNFSEIKSISKFD